MTTTPSKITEPEWVTEVLSWRKPSTKLPVMCRVPENMRSADKDEHVFEPVLVSIGPFHHGKFPTMEEHKTRFLNSMINRHENMDKREFLIKLGDAFRTDEERLRKSYSESFPDIDFVKMMVFDGCFILEIFRIHAGLYMDQADDPVFMERWMLPALALDIVKLENQIPYFVLDLLYERTKLVGEPTLIHLARSFLDFLCPGFNRVMIEDDRSQNHLLSLFHSTCIPNKNLVSIPISDEGNCTNSFLYVTHPCFSRIKDEKDCLNSFSSATDLCLSGIKVVKKKQGRNLLQIMYTNDILSNGIYILGNGKLEIPTLLIDCSTKILMRNLVVYEQCNKTVPYIFTSYLTFMNALVKTVEDVEELRKAGVINHFMKNKEVSVVLNNLTTNIKFDMNRGYLAGLSAQIYRAHHRLRGNAYMTVKNLIRSAQGPVFALALFGVYLAVLQAVFTVISYISNHQQS